MKNVKRQFATCILAVVLLSSCGLLHANDLNNYIIGGRVVVDEAQYPFMVSVYFDTTGVGTFTPGCGGTLIADRWVLTAAHCLVNKNFKRLIAVDRVGVLVGEKDLTTGQQENFVKAKQLISHPDFDPVTNKNDVGLIELAEPYIADLAVLPAVDSSVPILGEPSVVLGWGVIEEAGPVSTKLREVALPVISNAACFPFYSEHFDSRLAFCAGGSRAGGKDACQGDSGGPLLVTRDTAANGSVQVVAGIVSYGDGCARRGIPGVYTRVEAFTDWITGYTSGTFEYIGRPDEQPVDDTAITQLAVNTSTTGQLNSGQVAYFDVTGAKQVNLTSISGDADLFIIDDSDFQDISAELVRCSSTLSDAIDLCLINDDQLTAYAVVYGYRDSSYTISSQLVTSSSGTTLPLESGAQSGLSDSGGGTGSLSRASFLLLLIISFIRLKAHSRAHKDIEVLMAGWTKEAAHSCIWSFGWTVFTPSSHCFEQTKRFARKVQKNYTQ